MDKATRWDLAITHRTTTDLVDFVAQYFDEKDRRILLIGGAGFDPRTTLVAECLAAASHATLDCLLLREVRPDPDLRLEAAAADNIRTIETITDRLKVEDVQVFDSDNSPLGGRRAATIVSKFPFHEFHDVVVDLSALSVGISFPVIRLLVEHCIRGHRDLNLHVMVAHQPGLDARIRAVPNDKVTPVHGFSGGLSLSRPAGSRAKLWLPHLAPGRSPALRTIYESTGPDEVCPVIPFPAQHPRLGDDLLEELLGPDGFPWEMDARSLVYADEDDPLDLYRTTMRLHRLREPVFAEFGGSTLILTPAGSKVLALGALLAALERDLPVIHLEDFGYTLDLDNPVPVDQPTLMHVWLEGQPYEQDRPLLDKVGAAGRP